LLGPPEGQRIADIACGHGRITRELARRGGQVTGIDISGALISKALELEQAQPLSIHYLHADVTLPEWHAPAAFDAVTCNFGLSDIDDLDQAAMAISDSLRPGGRFVFSILHPCFPGGTDIAGSWPPDARYYDEGRWTTAAALSTLRSQVGTNHRTLSTYLNTLRGHGLELDQLSEPLPPPQWGSRPDQPDRGPVFLAARHVKPG
jgi:2-polyprenyl-3-methyl-5-hydroxy-6-metoxy-1,4-benzoquinol methylase